MAWSSATSWAAICASGSRWRGRCRLGYRALVFDFRGYNRLDDDVVAAVAELRRRGVTKVVLVGSSMGGTAVLLAATRIRPAVAGEGRHCSASTGPG
jgi:pimeloyl-ACP methyl ester carboxylesterase